MSGIPWHFETHTHGPDCDVFIVWRRIVPVRRAHNVERCQMSGIYVQFTPRAPWCNRHKSQGFRFRLGFPRPKMVKIILWWLESWGPSGKMGSRLSQNRLQQKLPVIDNQLCGKATDWCSTQDFDRSATDTIGQHFWGFRVAAANGDESCKWWLQLWSIDLLLLQALGSQGVHKNKSSWNKKTHLFAQGFTPVVCFENSLCTTPLSYREVISL